MRVTALLPIILLGPQNDHQHLLTPGKKMLRLLTMDIVGH